MTDQVFGPGLAPRLPTNKQLTSLCLPVTNITTAHNQASRFLALLPLPISICEPTPSLCLVTQPGSQPFRAHALRPSGFGCGAWMRHTHQNTITNTMPSLSLRTSTSTLNPSAREWYPPGYVSNNTNQPAQDGPGQSSSAAVGAAGVSSFDLAELPMEVS